MPMPPVARRMRKRARWSSPDPLLALPLTRRSRIARQVRTRLRQLDAVALRSARWSEGAAFLDGLALDLGCGRPALSSHTLRLPAMHGRSLPEIWNQLVDMLRPLAPLSAEEGPIRVADARGFRWSMARLLGRVQAHSPVPVALLIGGAENLPLPVLEALSETWGELVAMLPAQRRLVVLLSGIFPASTSPLQGVQLIELADYTEEEAQAVLESTGRGLPAAHLRQLAVFSGGIPALVDRFRFLLLQEQVPSTTGDGLLQALGTLGDEMRGAVDIVASEGRLAGRLERLLSGQPLPFDADLDEPILQAGLIRPLLHHRQRCVMVRAPAIAALMG